MTPGSANSTAAPWSFEPAALTSLLDPLLKPLLSAALAGVLCSALPCQASALRFCAGPDQLSPAEKDRLFRFGALIKDELERSGQGLALIARSGLDLSRFGQRYSHAGITLQASDNAPWSVRQLYYACDESRPRIYDQGIAGFVLGTDEPAVGYVSLVFLPPELAQALEQTALDKHQALQVLSGTYSANAYPFSVQYQNCNQWVLEMMALAWGGAAVSGIGSTGGGGGGPDSDTRSAAQAWLRAAGYTPTTMDVGWRPLVWLGLTLPWLHSDDHPQEDLDRVVFRVSMPAAIEAFVQARSPQATRVELCHNTQHLVVHRGWDAIAEGCVPGPGDTVIALQ